MIARFRAVGWVASVAAAALSCYLVSLQVAAERGQLMKLERRILSARQDVRQLQTELYTRGRLVQLERFNSDFLGLQAPKVSQYATGAVQLAAYLQPRPGAIAPVVVASASVAAAVPAVVAAAYARPSAPASAPAPAAPRPASAAETMVHHATYAAPAPRPAIERVALATRPAVVRPGGVRIAPAGPPPPGAALLADNLMRDIGRAAAAEARTTKQR